MEFNSTREAWQIVRDAMTFLENEGELTNETDTIEGNTVSCNFNFREQGWKLDFHNGTPDGN